MLSSQVSLSKPSAQRFGCAQHIALPTDSRFWLLQGSLASQKPKTDSGVQGKTVERQPSAVVVELDAEEEV